ncbi:peptidylprolyl isomerase [Kitasatospora sp. NPDC085879]|uniref:peptidylprolyl isomerase n=1 Tax=Kitasatospora sp. NPDC085879 TaxID=3154769 RepID=UPI000BB1192C|nr:peptidylprolyl isomerase [Streptomyces sp. TLI_235]PBC76351.1 peptidyl-prolyl cis-trans isomerase B (cyclophilin B) [Streptomyces sp. TLI_235]
MVSSEQRRRQLAREKYERQMQRRAEAQQHARKRNVLVGAAVAVAVVAAAGTAWALSGSDGDKKDAAAAPTPTAAAPVKGCTTPAPGSPNGKQFKSEPAMTVDTKAAYTMTLDTSCGKITIALDAAKAPHTVNSFAFLSNEKYFDHTKCHRLTTEGIYVLQCGDPTGTGSGGPGYQFADENLTGATYPAGTVAMANAGPGTNGSQFFLVYKDTQLPPSYTPFGKVTGGLDVVQNIASGGVQGGGADGAPVADMVLNSVTTAKG